MYTLDLVVRWGARSSPHVQQVSLTCANGPSYAAGRTDVSCCVVTVSETLGSLKKLYVMTSQCDCISKVLL